MTPIRAMAKTPSSALVLARPLDQNPAAVYLASLAPGSRRTMHDALDEIAGMLSKRQADAFALNWGALRFQHTTAIRSKLAESQSAATVNKKLSALRGVLSAAFRLGQMNAEDYTRARDIRGVKGSTLPAGRALAPGEIEALLNVCRKDNKPSGARDGAIIALWVVGGLRRAELCTLDLKDWDQASGAIRVVGKGNKERTVYVKNGAARWLRDWLQVRGSKAGAMFVPVSKGGRIFADRRLVPQTIFDLLARRALQAGVKELSPHDFRRTFISSLLDAGVDIVTVQKMAGHASVTTTARYDRRDEKAKERATDYLHVPYWERMK